MPRSFYIQYCNTDPITGKRLVEPYPNKIYVVQNPPAAPLSQEEMDEVYAYPYMRTYHPSYEKLGGVPAISEIKFSLVSNRGCFGGCSFCALTFHQGRIIQTRSHESIVEEAKLLTKEPDFKGYIHDVGGPTADFRRPGLRRNRRPRASVPNRQCLFPKPCKNLRADHKDYLELLRKLRELPKVKKVFIRSGIRFDYVLADPDDTFFRELVQYHISGQLKVAPEHVSDQVLHYMGKPEHAVFMQFTEKYKKLNEKYGMNQYPGALSDVLPSGLYHEGGREAGGVLERSGVHAGAGAGFLPDALHDFHLHVLYRAGSPDHGTGLCADESP